jgi:hypothetical protein
MAIKLTPVEELTTEPGDAPTTENQRERNRMKPMICSLAQSLAISSTWQNSPTMARTQSEATSDGCAAR